MRKREWANENVGEQMFAFLILLILSRSGCVCAISIHTFCLRVVRQQRINLTNEMLCRMFDGFQHDNNNNRCALPVPVPMLQWKSHIIIIMICRSFTSSAFITVSIENPSYRNSNRKNEMFVVKYD